MTSVFRNVTQSGERCVTSRKRPVSRWVSFPLSSKRDRSGAAISDGRVLCQVLIIAIFVCAAKSIWVFLLSFFITRCLESLASMDKTGIKYIDKLLAMISMIVYTYGNKHQVQKWWVVLLQISTRYWVNFRHVLGRLPFARTDRPKRTNSLSLSVWMERSRPVRAITHTILAWNTRKSPCKQHGGFGYETF